MMKKFIAYIEYTDEKDLPDILRKYNLDKNLQPEQYKKCYRLYLSQEQFIQCRKIRLKHSCQEIA